MFEKGFAHRYQVFCSKIYFPIGPKKKKRVINQEEKVCPAMQYFMLCKQQVSMKS